MAEVDTTLLSTATETAFFVADETTKDTDKKTGANGSHQRFIAGEYLTHITECITRVVDVKKGLYKARVYNLTVVVAKENDKMSYKVKDIAGDDTTVSGHHFIGRKIKVMGVFKFLEPVEGDTFESNSGENMKYLRLCETVGVTPKTETRTIAGKETKVQILPNLDTEDVLGKPVISVVGLSRDTYTDKGGNTRNYFEVKFVKQWEGGTIRETTQVSPDDLPF